MPSKDEMDSARTSLLTRLCAGHALTLAEAFALLGDLEAHAALAEILADYAEYRRLCPKWVEAINYAANRTGDDIDACAKLDAVIEEMEGTNG